MLKLFFPLYISNIDITNWKSCIFFKNYFSFLFKYCSKAGGFTYFNMMNSEVICIYVYYKLILKLPRYIKMFILFNSYGIFYTTTKLGAHHKRFVELPTMAHTHFAQHLTRIPSHIVSLLAAREREVSVDSSILYHFIIHIVRF